MPSAQEDKPGRWVTVGGKRLFIPEGEEDKMPDIAGEKGQNTREAKKTYVQRFGLLKSMFYMHDRVSYDMLNKTGVIYGFDGDYLKILGDDNRTVLKHRNDVFKSNELIDTRHWDTMTSNARIDTLIKAKLSKDYSQTNWQGLPDGIKKELLKATSTPAGFESGDSGGGVNTNSPGVYNPVSQDKTISQRIRDAVGNKDGKKRTDT